MRNGEHAVSLDIAEMLGFGDAPDDRCMRAAGAPQIEQQADHYPGDDAQFDTRGKRNCYGCNMRGEIAFRIAPQLPRSLQVDQCEHRHDDGRRERGDRQVEQQGGEEQPRQRNAERSVGTRSGGFGTRVEIDHRTRETAGDRVTARDCARDIGRAQSDQFLIGRDALPPFGGQRLRDRDALDEADHRDQQGGDPQSGDQVGIGRGQREWRQALRDRADEVDAARTKVEG